MRRLRKLHRKQREAEAKDREQKLQEDFEEEVRASSKKNKSLADMVAEDRVEEEEPPVETVEEPQLDYEAPKINYLNSAQFSPTTIPMVTKTRGRATPRRPSTSGRTRS